MKSIHWIKHVILIFIVLLDFIPSSNASESVISDPFTHQTSDVWSIEFDKGESIGVTYYHPIFSVSKGDWQFAGHLEIGEEVLTKGGNTKVVSKERDLTEQPVYNFEVWREHNYYVGSKDSGEFLLVHNSCWNLLKDIFKIFNISFDNAIKLPGKKWTHKIRSTDKTLDLEVDFSEEIGEKIGKRIALAPDGTEGFDAISEAGTVMSYKVMSGNSVSSNLSQLKDNLSTAINKYKNHHSDKSLTVDIYVRGNHLTKQAALENWNIIKDVNVQYTANKSVIGKIFYKGPDGFVEFN